MPYTPIGEFARGFSHILKPQRRLIVVLRAYFDDSGTHAGSKVLVLAGFMGSPDEWSKFEDEWADILKKEGIKSFHARDFHGGYGQCKDWPLTRRELVRGDLRRVLAARNIIGIGATVRVDDWESSASPAIKDRYISPLYLAFEHCIQQTLHWAQCATDQQTGEIEKVSFFFDSFNREVARCFDIGKAYEHGWIRSDWFEGIAFGQTDRMLPLQAADMLAHETYRLEHGRLTSGTEPTLSPHLKALLEDLPIHGQYYDREALTILASQMVHRQPHDLLVPPDAAAVPSS